MKKQFEQVKELFYFIAGLENEYMEAQEQKKQEAAAKEKAKRELYSKAESSAHWRKDYDTFINQYGGGYSEPSKANRTQEVWA